MSTLWYDSFPYIFLFDFFSHHHCTAEFPHAIHYLNRGWFASKMAVTPPDVTMATRGANQGAGDRRPLAPRSWSRRWNFPIIPGPLPCTCVQMHQINNRTGRNCTRLHHRLQDPVTRRFGSALCTRFFFTARALDSIEERHRHHQSY